MARILIAWELGGGWGHAMVYAPLVRELRRRGHEVAVAAPDPAASARLCGADVPHLRSPGRAIGSKLYAPAVRCYSDILANAGFGDSAELGSLAAGWRGIIERASADVVVADHAPTALLAARGIAVPSAALGTGFCCPPSPHLPALAGNADPSVPEEILTDHANAVIHRFGGKRLAWLGELYSDCAARILTTVAELDHFGPRQASAEYVGSWSSNEAGAATPVWSRPGPRVFAYLRQAEDVEGLLARISALGCACFAVCPGSALAARWPGVVVCRDRIDIEAAARECDVGICHGGHGTTFELLRHGKPALILPVVVEQRLLGQRVAALGVGVMASRRNAADAAAALSHLLDHLAYPEAAARFAYDHRKYDPTSGVTTAADIVERVALGKGRP